MKKLLFLLIFYGIYFLNAQERPNILFIAVDDLKPTIGSFGDTYAITPNMDKLSAKGTVFLNNHAQQAICGPSRASLLTGKRPDYTRVWNLKTKMRDENPNILTIPQYFKQNGYETIGLGKIYDYRCIDSYKDKPSWSVPYIEGKTFKYPKGYNSPTFGYYQSPDIISKIDELRNEAKNKGEKNIRQYVLSKYKPPYEIGDVPDEAYVDGAIAVKSMELLENIDASKPFFLAVGFMRPHLPFVAPRKYWDLYDDSKIPLAAYQEKSKNAVDIAYHNSNELRSYKVPGIEYSINDDNLLELDTELQKKLIHGYYASTSYIDAQIGKIINKLKSTGLDKNTIIIIWGDHGWHLGDHSMWNKHSNFEQATRSPMLIFDPRVNKGNKVEMPTEFVDIFPTLCEMSGLEIPKNLDGVSLKKQVEGINISTKVYAVSQYPRERGRKMGYSFRTQQHRYTVWIKNKKSTSPIFTEDIIGEELYDYEKDINETNNVIDNKDYENTKKAFQLLVAQYFKSQVSKDDNANKTSQDKAKPKINRYAKKRADTISKYIISKMRLPEPKTLILNKILYEKYARNASKTHNQNLTREQKNTIYKETYTLAIENLKESFTKEEINTIKKLEREFQNLL